MLYNYSDETGVHAVVGNLITPWSLQLSVLVAACFVVGLVAVRVDSAALRFVLSLLPGLSFLMSPLQPILLIHAAAWLYFVIVMTIGYFEEYLDVYRRRARLMLVVALVFTCCLIVYHFGMDSWYSNKLFGGEGYGLFFFVLSVLSLRGMRSSLGTPGRMRVVDTAYVVVLPALLVSLFFLLRGIVPVLTFFLKMLSRFLIWLFRTISPQEETPGVIHVEEEEDPYAEPSDSFVLPGVKDNRPNAEMMEGGNLHLHLPSQLGLWLTVVFLLAALIFLAIWLYRKNRKSGVKPSPVREHIERPSFEGLLRRRAGESGLPANVRQIRKVYRAYLNHILSLRMRISPSDTSEDVLELSSKSLDMPENATLRELYIAARYGDPKAVTSEQVGEAKRCLSVIEAVKSAIPE